MKIYDYIEFLVTFKSYFWQKFYRFDKVKKYEMTCQFFLDLFNVKEHDSINKIYMSNRVGVRGRGNHAFRNVWWERNQIKVCNPWFSWYRVGSLN